MKKVIWIAIFLLITAVAIMAAVLLFHKKSTQVCFSNNCFDVEIADNPVSRELGLMFRKHLNQNEGMFFMFQQEENYSFWMKNTLIPLDIIWINQDKEVVFISKNNQPCKGDTCQPINPDVKAKYILEINAGLSDNIGISVGTKVEF